MAEDVRYKALFGILVLLGAGLTYSYVSNTWPFGGDDIQLIEETEQWYVANDLGQFDVFAISPSNWKFTPKICTTYCEKAGQKMCQTDFRDDMCCCTAKNTPTIPSTKLIGQVKVLGCDGNNARIMAWLQKDMPQWTNKVVPCSTLKSYPEGKAYTTCNKASIGKTISAYGSDYNKGMGLWMEKATKFVCK